MDAMTDLHATAKQCLDATDPAEKPRLTEARMCCAPGRQAALRSSVAVA